MPRIARVSVAATALFAALLAVDHLRSTEPVTAVSLRGDVLDTALLAGAVMATGLVAVETREMRHERRGPMSTA